MPTRFIYKICTASEWAEAVRVGVYEGSVVDARGGFIHFSARNQVSETAAKHFAGQKNLVLIEVDVAALPEGLRWEVSRGRARFPHLYGAVPVSAVRETIDLPLDGQGIHQLPAGWGEEDG